MEFTMRTLCVVIVFCMTLISCATEPQESSLVGLCMKVVQSTFIWRGYDNIYVGEFLLSRTKPSRLVESSESIGKVQRGAKVELIEILKGSNGSYGAFLRGRVRIMEGEFSGVVADVPACVPYHPPLKWIENC